MVCYMYITPVLSGVDVTSLILKMTFRSGMYSIDTGQWAVFPDGSISPEYSGTNRAASIVLGHRPNKADTQQRNIALLNPSIICGKVCILSIHKSHVLIHRQISLRFFNCTSYISYHTLVLCARQKNTGKCILGGS